MSRLLMILNKRVPGYQPLAHSPITDTTRHIVRLHRGNPRQDPKPSEANGNIFNDSANGSVVGVLRCD